jgi:DNA-binding transcriptional MerR regulator
MSKSLTIGQVATAIGVSAHTLRYYEQAGLLRSIGRSSGGHRLYSPSDLDWLQFVMRLKATGMPIAAIQAFAELRAQGESTYGARREMLAEHRDEVLSRLADLQANLAAITDKIAWYEAAANLAVRHDDRFPTHQSEKDSPWNKHSTPPAPTTTAATSKAGKS